MANILSYEQHEQHKFENQEHEVSELICLNCFRRFIGVYPSKNWLKDMECECGAIGKIIKTGQTLPEEDE